MFEHEAHSTNYEWETYLTTLGIEHESCFGRWTPLCWKLEQEGSFYQLWVGDELNCVGRLSLRLILGVRLNLSTMGRRYTQLCRALSVRLIFKDVLDHIKYCVWAHFGRYARLRWTFEHETHYPDSG